MEPINFFLQGSSCRDKLALPRFLPSPSFPATLSSTLASFSGFEPSPFHVPFPLDWLFSGVVEFPEESSTQIERSPAKKLKCTHFDEDELQGRSHFFDGFHRPFRVPRPPVFDSVMVADLPPSATPQSAQAKERRRKIADRLGTLRRLLPWEKKLDTATMLQEAFKYVKFLEAQVRTLTWMPPAGGSAWQETSGCPASESLNRWEFLQMMVNSPAMQRQLYEVGLCVFSVEQVELLKMLQMETMMPGGPMAIPW